MPVIDIITAAAADPERPVISFYRVSGRAQSKSSLPVQREFGEMERRESGLLISKGVYAVIESGKLSERRPRFDHTVARCRKTGAYLYAVDLLRVLRPRAFDAVRNPFAPLTDDDLNELAERTRGLPGIVLAVDPKATPQQIRELEKARGLRAAAARGTRNGRPSTVSNSAALEIATWIDHEPLSAIAARLRISPDAARRSLDRIVPGSHELCGRDLTFAELSSAITPQELSELALRWERDANRESPRLIRNAADATDQTARAKHERYCEMCDTTFPASRADACWCSARCRMRARRAAKRWR